MSTPEMDHVEWPCDNYTEPVTCLTARATETGQCRVCRIRAVDRLLAALYGADLRERVEALADEWAVDPVGGDLWRSEAIAQLLAALTVAGGSEGRGAGSALRATESTPDGLGGRE